MTCRFMYTIDEYKKLVSQYGPFSSWAIWNSEDQSDSSIIDQYYEQLHSKFILLGLNISQPLAKGNWSNFHDGPSNVRKLKYACTDNELRGSYITDIFKGIVEQKSNKFKNLLTDEIINENVDLFNQEMKDVRINDDSRFIVFGPPTSDLARYFNRYFTQKYRNEIIYHYHYAYYSITDKEWVETIWKKLGIYQNFDLTVRKYKK